MPIDRAKSIAYAERYWDRPCDDGVFWVSNDVINVDRKRKELKAPAADGWVALFVPDGAGAEKAVFRKPGSTDILIQPWEGLTDCAHYLSHCLQAGGVGVNERGVASLVNTLRDRSDTKTLAERVSKTAGQRLIDSGLFKKGDMIGYFNIAADGDFDGARRYTHSTMYAGVATGNGRITCHTKSRYPGAPPKGSFANEWFIDDDYTYTFIHFSNDDARPTPTMSALLHSWWKVSSGTHLEYYYFLPNGTARRSLTAPRRESPPGANKAGPAHWFVMNPAQITLCWQKTADIEVWKTTGKAGEFSVSINGAAGKASKVSF